MSKIINFNPIPTRGERAFVKTFNISLNRPIEIVKGEDTIWLELQLRLTGIHGNQYPMLVYKINGGEAQELYPAAGKTEILNGELQTPTKITIQQLNFESSENSWKVDIAFSLRAAILPES